MRYKIMAGALMVVGLTVSADADALNFTFPASTCVPITNQFFSATANYSVEGFAYNPSTTSTLALNCPLNRTDGPYHQWDEAGAVVINVNNSDQYMQCEIRVTYSDGSHIFSTAQWAPPQPVAQTIFFLNPQAIDDETASYVINCYAPKADPFQSRVLQTYLNMP